MANTTENVTGFKTFTATAAAIARGVRVQFDGTNILVAGATDVAIGVTQESIAASGSGTVKLFGAPGTFLIQVHSSMNAGVHLYPAAAGRVDDAGTTKIGLLSLEAATAQGDIIECTPVLLGA